MSWRGVGSVRGWSGVGVTSGASGRGVGCSVTERDARVGVGPRGVGVFGAGEPDDEAGCDPGAPSGRRKGS